MDICSTSSELPQFISEIRRGDSNKKSKYNKTEDEVKAFETIVSNK